MTITIIIIIVMIITIIIIIIDRVLVGPTGYTIQLHKTPILIDISIFDWQRGKTAVLRRGCEYRHILWPGATSERRFSKLHHESAVLY